jgi:hypothetical protein
MHGLTAAAEKWVQMRVLVTVKAYPSISTKYGEAVCVAGTRLDTPTPEWVRFFPVAYRDLPIRQRFQKYEVITLRATDLLSLGRNWRARSALSVHDYHQT